MLTFEDTIYQFIACKNCVLSAFNSDNQRMGGTCDIQSSILFHSYVLCVGWAYFIGRVLGVIYLRAVLGSVIVACRLSHLLMACDVLGIGGGGGGGG